jgi:hypothetical protein
VTLSGAIASGTFVEITYPLTAPLSQGEYDLSLEVVVNNVVVDTLTTKRISVLVPAQFAPTTPPPPLTPPTGQNDPWLFGS